MFSSQNSQVSSAANYIEDVFSTYLYKGNGSTQTITNGIDLSGKGGMVWTKSRTNANEALIYDTVRGVNKYIIPSSTQAAQTSSGTLTAFNIDGFTLGSNDNSNDSTTENSVGWTFRKQPKFFDVVTFTQTSTSSNFRVNHSLGSVPACIIIKCTSTTSGWYVYHRSLGRSQYMRLEATSNAASSTDIWGTSDPTSTDFGINAGGLLEGVGTTYVAYLFAHNAGGFGLTGADNVISCGSYAGNGGVGPVVNLGYEPQWVMIKNATTGGTYMDWYMFDNMRKLDVSGSKNAPLLANSSAAEGGTYASSSYNLIQPTSTGFAIDNAGFGATGVNASGDTYIYIAIRRGPMKVPTSGTSVFYSASFNDQSSSFPTGFVTDFAINKVTYYNPDLATYTVGSNFLCPRLTNTQGLSTNTTNTESNAYVQGWDIEDGYKWANGSGYNIFGWAFQRAPSFADVVLYSGDGTSNRAIAHNLGAVPELFVVKQRSPQNNTDWNVYSAPTGNTGRLRLNTTGAKTTDATIWASTTPTASNFYVSTTSFETNYSGSTYVAYLFSTCAGVSKVGSYTGTGSTQTINCGFTSGARFVLIKRTDTTGAWFVYDSSRGIQSGNDPYLLWNSDAVPVTSTNYVDAAATGFQVIGTGLNVNGGTYIFLAIA